MKSVLTYLEGARIQAAGALAVLTGRGRTPHPLSPHLKVARDRRGLQQTILTVIIAWHSHIGVECTYIYLGICRHTIASLKRHCRNWKRFDFQVPPWLQHEYRGVARAPAQDGVNSSPPSSPTTPAHTSRCLDRGAADGVSIQHYSDVGMHAFLWKKMCTRWTCVLLFLILNVFIFHF